MHLSPARRRLAIAMRVAIPVAFAATLFFVPSTSATSVSDAEALVISWVNHDRMDRGLAPLRTDGNLASIAGIRASRMASANVMSHTVGGNLASQLNWYGVYWYRYAETIGWSTASFPTTSARSIYLAWMGSSEHRALLLSNQLNYIGVGLAYRSSNHRTFASAVLSESPDHTRPIARVTGVSRSGDDVRWTWSGYDPRLQTHTAGFRDYDVQYRVGSGLWSMIRDNTTSASILIANRPGGRYYSIRVRGTDRRGNVGAWSSESRIWVP
jgi:uncharacterized protein YkwD